MSVTAKSPSRSSPASPANGATAHASPATPAGEECPSRILLSAAQRILSGSLVSLAEWENSAEELAALTLAAQRAATGEANLKPTANGQLRKKLLSLLEAEVINEREQNGHAANEEHGHADALDALKRVRAAVEAPPSDQELEARLAGPEGLELVSEIAHDLRSPMTSILTLAEALRRGHSGEVNEIQRRQLGLIYSAALALSSTASDVIELAHGGDRLAQKDPTPFSTVGILESVRAMVYPMAEEKVLDLRFQSEGSDWRLGYPLALSRVILNLTTNALKFTDKGYVEISVRPSGPEEVEISVRDTGRGIDPATLPRLFEPFQQAAGNRTRFSGTGLGLVICRRLVEAMGSKLQLETRKDWGTRFFFRLKLPPTYHLT